LSDIPPSALTETISAKMFLYEKPELLTVEKHGSLGVTPPERPFRFAESARVIPITAVEFGSAQRHYPIVFASLENPVPLAVLGVLEDTNLFVDDGQWDPACYMPSYLRCYPFAFASSEQGNVAVVIDRAAEAITENPRFPFFDNGKPTRETESMIRFCSQYEAERQRTNAFCQKLKELELLTHQQANFKPDGGSSEQTLASFVSIDSKKVTDLDAGTVHELHRSGQLSAIYMQLYSQENWRVLLARRARRQAPGADGPAAD